MICTSNRILNFEYDIESISRLYRLFYAFSQILNVLFGGSHNRTIQEEHYRFSYVTRRVIDTSDESVPLLKCGYYEDTYSHSFIMRLLISLDQFFNVLFWNGSHKETISSNIGRKIEKNKHSKIDKVICICLRKIENRHCFKSVGE